jgi:hypothetical protein
MKITLSTRDNTVVLDNEGTLSSDKMRRILDILMDEQPVPKASSGIPLDIDLYERWLAQSGWDTASTALSHLTSYDITEGISTVYYVIRHYPEFATVLGQPRFLATCKWMYNRGKLRYLPSEESLLRYYSLAVRSLV